MSDRDVWLEAYRIARAEWWRHNRGCFHDGEAWEYGAEIAAKKIAMHLRARLYILEDLDPAGSTPRT